MKVSPYNAIVQSTFPWGGQNFCKLFHVLVQLFTQVGEKLKFAKSGFAVFKPSDKWRLKIKLDMANNAHTWQIQDTCTADQPVWDRRPAVQSYGVWMGTIIQTNIFGTVVDSYLMFSVLGLVFRSLSNSWKSDTSRLRLAKLCNVHVM